jgi:putative ABC transport system permease protein
MSSLRGFVKRVRALLGRRAAERELDEEIAFHLERQTEKLVRGGVAPAEARRLALASFGGATQAREAHRAARGLPWLDDLVRDVRYAARGLARSRLFTITAVATLTLGIGATTVVVSVVRALLFHPTPIARPSRLAIVWQWAPYAYTPSTSMAEGVYSYSHYLAFRDATSDVFESVGGYAYGSVALRDGEGARSISAAFTTGNYFHVLGLRPAAGRFYTAEQDQPGRASPEVVISYDFWQREYHGDAAVLGKTVYADSRAFDVVGIAPRGFNGMLIGLATDVWIPATVSHTTAVTIFGRLRDGVTHERARAILDVSAPPPVPYANFAKRPAWRVRLDPGDGVPQMARVPLNGSMSLLVLTAGFVLLIAATNVAGMLLARATARRREVAIRLAIGASRGRLVRQLVGESLLLGLIGAGGGLLLTRWLTGLASGIDVPIGPRVSFDARVDGAVLAVSIGVALFAGILAGLAPALQATRFDLVHTLRDGGSRQPGRAGGMRSALVVVQVALSFALLLTAGLFTRAFERALEVDPGLDATNVVVARLQPAAHGYDSVRTRAFYAQLVSRLSARAEVASVGLGAWTPLSGGYNGTSLPYPGDSDPHGRRLAVAYGVADAGYLSALHVTLLEGRNFTGTDDPDGPPVAIVNEVLARRFWPNESAIGKPLFIDGPARPPREIVGVVRGGKVRSLAEDANAYMYIPLGQRFVSSLQVFVRGRGDVASTLAALRESVRELDPNIALDSAGPFDAVLAVNIMPQRVAALVVGILGLAGLALASIGIYGLVAYVVAQRTREFGIRMALGARGRDVVSLAQQRALVLVGSGGAVGLLLALAIGRLASSLLFGVSAADPVTLMVIPALFGALGFLASYIPARRAARADPMESLRTD